MKIFLLALMLLLPVKAMTQVSDQLIPDDLDILDTPEGVPSDDAEMNSSSNQNKKEFEDMMPKDENAPAAEYDPYLELELKKDLDSSDFSTIRKLKSLDRRYYTIRTSPRESYRAKQTTSKQFMAVLKKGSVIYDEKLGNAFVTRKKIYLVAKQEIEGGQIAEIFSPNKELSFTTKTTNIVSIQEDLDLPPGLHSHQTYPPDTHHHTNDKVLKLENFLIAHAESIYAPYFEDIFNTTSGSSSKASAKRYEARSFVKSFLPVDLGLIASGQNGEWAQDTIVLEWKSFYAGPALQYTFIKNEDFSLLTQFSFQKSILFESTSVGGGKQTYSANVWEAYLAGKIPTPIGGIVLGVGYRSYSASLKTSDQALNTNPSRESLTSIGISLGYSFDLNI